MSTVKVILRKEKRKKDGSNPLALRIIKDRRVKYIHLGPSVLEKDWDFNTGRVKRSHPNSVRLNNFILQKLADATNISLEIETNRQEVSTLQLKRKIKRQGQRISFFELAEKRLEDHASKGTFSVYNAERSILNNFSSFLDGRDIMFEDINTSLLESFKVYCQGSLKQSPRTVTNQLIFIRTMFNRAIKDDIVHKKYYPFGGDKIRITIKSGHKIGLNVDEIKAIEGLTLKRNTPIWHTRNVWLFAFYFAGIRISDVLKLKWNDFKDGRLYYTMNKNDKPVSLKIPSKAEGIMKLYEKRKQKGGIYIFPYLNKADEKDELDLFRKTRTATRKFNRCLELIANQAGITKKLTTHIARHSFGNIAGDKINPLMLQKLYRHSDLKTTINYQANFIYKDADESLDKVVDF